MEDLVLETEEILNYSKEYILELLRHLPVASRLDIIDNSVGAITEIKSHDFIKLDRYLEDDKAEKFNMIWEFMHKKE